MMKLREFYPPYLWRFLVQRSFHRTHPETPLLVANAVILLDNWLKPSDRGIEFGSGRSTSWLAQRLAHLTSVEHDARWYQRVVKRIAQRGLADKVDYRLIAAAGEQMDEPKDHPYAAVADEMADESLDFALVDGQMRLRCLQRVMPKLKPGGLLALDGANRYLPNRFEEGHTTIQVVRNQALNEEWQQAADSLKAWRWINTSDGLWDTRFWVKPG
jgi:tRNA A58 N-methylase Trm61